jgi:hypothetical protein
MHKVLNGGRQLNDQLVPDIGYRGKADGSAQFTPDGRSCVWVGMQVGEGWVVALDGAVEFADMTNMIRLPHATSAGCSTWPA